jgi:hypothetical protein
MNVHDSSSIRLLASLASGLYAEKLGQAISIAVLKQKQDQMEMEGAALIQMTQQTPSPDIKIG